MTKPDAKLAIGVPTMVSRGSDVNAFNAHRIYGPVMYPFLTTNWKFVWPTRGKTELDWEKILCIFSQSLSLLI